MSEYDILLPHISHDVFLELAGYDAPIRIICGDCSDTLLSYGDPKGFKLDGIDKF